MFTLVYDPMPSIGFPTADVRRVVFHGRHSIEHLHEGEGGEMQWRFVGETLDLDAQQIDEYVIVRFVSVVPPPHRCWRAYL